MKFNSIVFLFWGAAWDSTSAVSALFLRSQGNILDEKGESLRMLGENGPANNPAFDANEEGCPRRNNPVCADGITYQNECLARQQGETEMTNGPCKGDKPSMFRQSEERITPAEMRRFEEEGFIYTGDIEIRHDGPSTEIEFVGEGQGVTPGPNLAFRDERLSRVSPRGGKYIAKKFKPKYNVDTTPVQGSSSRAAPPPGLVPGGDDRKLAVHGEDTRVKVSSPFEYPYWRLGELDWGSGEGGCSATIVGSNKVLTAAHCVYDIYTDNYIVPDKFAPGRYRVCDSTGCWTREPWATWKVAYATIYTAWTNIGSYTFENAKYDVAILTMETNWAGNIGEYMGFLPLIGAPCEIDPNSHITGYPGSKPDGEMWDSGSCEYWNHLTCDEEIVYHKCDTSGGNSGSGIYDSNYQVFGVHSGGSSSINAGFAFTDSTAPYISSWGG